MVKLLFKNALLSLGLFIFLLAGPCWAEDFGREPIAGADRSFTYGYSQAQEVHAFEERISQREELEALTAEPVSTSGDVDPEKMRVYKNFRIASLYDSNLTLSQSDPVDDSIFIYSPNLGFSLGRPGITKVFFKAFFNFSYVDYVEHQKNSRWNQTHLINMGFRGEKLEIRINNKFQPLSAREAGERTELSSPGGKRAIATTDDASVELIYHWSPKIDISSTYSYGIWYFPKDSNSGDVANGAYNYQHYGFLPKVSYKLDPKTTIDFGGGVSADDYFESGGFSSKNYSLATGFQRRLTSKTDLRLGVGYDRREYNTGSIPVSEGPRYGMTLLHRFSPKLSMAVSATQSKSQAFDFADATSETNSFDATSTSYLASVHWGFTPHTQLDGFFNIVDSNRDRDYTFADPENPATLHTRPIEDHVYTMGADWVWRPNSP